MDRLTLEAPDGVAIPAILTKPVKSHPRGHILLLHGITTNKDEYANFYGRLADSLAEAGLASLRFDFRGHGDSPISPRQFSISSQLLDCRTAVEWLTESQGAEIVDIFACSFGAPPAIYSARDIEQVQKIVLLSPVLDYSRTFLQPETDWAASIFNADTMRTAFITGELVMNEKFVIDVKLITEMSMVTPCTALRLLSKPSLILHGESDSMVPCQITKDCVASCEQVRFICMPRMEHGFTDEDDDDGESELSEKNYQRIVNETMEFLDLD